MQSLIIIPSSSEREMEICSREKTIISAQPEDVRNDEAITFLVTKKTHLVIQEIQIT